jgi:hypothetical protein
MTGPVFAGLCFAAGVIGLGRLPRGPPRRVRAVDPVAPPRVDELGSEDLQGRLSAVVYAAVQIGLIRRRTACAGVCGARRARLDVGSQRRR